MLLPGAHAARFILVAGYWHPGPSQLFSQSERRLLTLRCSKLLYCCTTDLAVLISSLRPLSAGEIAGRRARPNVTETGALCLYWHRSCCFLIYS
jgi:hypothetical protein